MENSRQLRSPVSNSLSSLSLPSEPLDIGNWFASYGYESPALGTNIGLVDSVSRENDGFVIRESTKEKEKDPDGIGKSRCKFNELGFVIKTSNPNVSASNCENQSSSEVLDSSYSPSEVSEPPDIRNWLSSYVYESFVLDTNDDVKDSVSHESESEKEAAANVGAFREGRGCGEMEVGQGSSSNGCFDDVKSFSKLSDSMDSASLFTDPPNIKNWFSSYVYESPVLNTSDKFGDYPHLERELDEDELIVEDSEGEEGKSVIIKQVKSRDEEADVGNVHSSKILEHDSSFGVDKQGKQSINKGIGRIERKERKESTSSLNNNLCSVKIFKENLEGKTLQSNDMSPSKDDKKPSFNDGSSISTPMQKFSRETCSVSLHVNTSSGNNSKKSPTMEESSEANVQIEGLGSGARKRIHGRNDRENENKENGFVATRKKACARTENEDMKGRPQGVSLECTRNKGTVCQTGEKDETVNRTVLTETTNFQHSDAIGVTGKWRCPQKSKPNRGPPLKQLRLERWVHKV